MQFRRPSKPNVGINIAPLVDVVFLLVIFFAVSTTFLETACLKLELPSSSSSAERESESLTVQLTADGQLAFEGELMEASALRERLAGALEASERKIVILRADTHAEHGEVVKVMDLIREAGAEGLTVDARAAAK